MMLATRLAIHFHHPPEKAQSVLRLHILVSNLQDHTLSTHMIGLASQYVIDSVPLYNYYVP